MDKAKVGFLFGQVPDNFNVDDSRDRQALLAHHQQKQGEERVPDLARMTIGEQIADDDPPETWLTAERLLDAGFSRSNVMNQLALAFVGSLTLSRDEPARVDHEKYLRALSSLPLPSPREVRDLLESIVRENYPIDPDDLERRVLERMGRQSDDPAAIELVDQATERLMNDELLDYLTDDRIVHLGALTAGITLTHRLTSDEIQIGILQAAADLSPFGRHEELRLSDGELIETYGDPGNWRWMMPEGWTKQFVAGQIVAVTVAEDGLTQIVPLDTPPAEDQDLVGRFRKAYDAEVAEPDVPPYLKDIVYELLARDPDSFAGPRQPLEELCRAVGLERRGAMVAHTEELWENLETLHLWRRAWEVFADDRDRSNAAIRVVELAHEPRPSQADLKLALHDLSDPEVANFVVEELASPDRADDQDLMAAEAFAAALTQNGGEGLPKAVAHWFAAVVSERKGELIVADSHLLVALSAGRDWAPLLERAAWYASDRGDAGTALALLRRMPDAPGIALETLSEYQNAPQPKLGRNDPCWCGSGRKFKQCHLAQPALFPLPERVSWLCFKAASYMQYRGGHATADIIALAQSRAVDPSDLESIGEALQDPLVMDAALTEGGWFETFLEDRGPLLPDDEVMLAESWLLVRRTVYEIERVDPGTGLRIRDLATGDWLDVAERTLSSRAQPGWMICARAVPDGEAHRFVGGIFAVRPGMELEVLDICAEEDPDMLCAFVADLEHPPRLTNREGEEMVSCTVEWAVRNPKAARRALNKRYRAEEDGWVELQELEGGEWIVRAQLRLRDSRLTVSTLSEERMDRVVEFLESTIDGVLLSDEREPIRPGMKLPDDPGTVEDPLSQVDPETLKQVMAEMQETIENRWMSEPVPALAGLTPREAAADPTRREMLERLLASFDEKSDLPSGAFTFRVDRLRRELGLD